LLFSTFATLTIAGAVAAVSLRNLVHSVLALAVAFTGLAALYLQLGAQFIGLAQVLVYIGAVAILIVFAILLTRNSGSSFQSTISRTWMRTWVENIAVILAVFAVIEWAISHTLASRRSLPPQPKAAMLQIGNALMLRFALPLEIVGLLLTVALIGAVTVALQERQESR
jgi:NADH-quinone oxidoreductase subunit J